MKDDDEMSKRFATSPDYLGFVAEAVTDEDAGEVHVYQSHGGLVSAKGFSMTLEQCSEMAVFLASVLTDDSK